mmetsp:Transcript_23593/g.39575  ORF Transcript_23593/g.39575 Transcript_23593/m.39575 type:complete len:249 (-) Transcript_23593:480-1226(-)
MGPLSSDHVVNFSKLSFFSRSIASFLMPLARRSRCSSVRSTDANWSPVFSETPSSSTLVRPTCHPSVKHCCKTATVSSDTNGTFSRIRCSNSSTAAFSPAFALALRRFRYSASVSCKPFSTRICSIARASSSLPSEQNFCRVSANVRSLGVSPASFISVTRPSALSGSSLAHITRASAVYDASVTATRDSFICAKMALAVAYTSACVNLQVTVGNSGICVSSAFSGRSRAPSHRSFKTLLPVCCFLRS